MGGGRRGRIVKGGTEEGKEEREREENIRGRKEEEGSEESWGI